VVLEQAPVPPLKVPISTVARFVVKAGTVKVRGSTQPRVL